MWKRLEEESSIINSLQGFVLAIDRITDGASEDAKMFLAEPWNYSVTRNDPQATGFWRELWPAFTDALKDECEAESVNQFQRPRG